ncbi:OLC1v1012738C1 [Oldenlandia corymbosa var. corymbosa]|uniref:OLC1v1012738C1 n=1 Tax=Oldenlandia corymbosa var. corymbosa TaxID=529605 RepID=A0AAV1DWN3_OLDCO|nr:OLC1v1012738C1 [Oldenlandia corymbosa var. corymbosa]
MQNEEGQNMDLYIPRKCSATNRLITSKDHASVQLNIGHLDEHGVYTGNFSTFALCGFVRAQVGYWNSAILCFWFWFFPLIVIWFCVMFSIFLLILI